MDSFSIQAETYTEPSQSEHEFLMEALDSLYHRNVTQVQIAAAQKLHELHMYLQGTDNVYNRKGIVDQMTEVRGERTRIKNRMAQEREERVKQLVRWEMKRHRG